MTVKIDLKRELSDLYTARRQPVLIEVPRLRFLMIDGHGDPNTSPGYAAAVQALFSVAYTAKFTVKRAPGGEDFTVMPLEGLWWAADMAAFSGGDKSEWDWTMMIAQPDLVTDEVFAQARATAAAKKPLACIDQVRLEALEEGPAAQVLHVGPYATEGPTIAALHAYIAAQGYRLAGKHHEIYLSDPSRTAPDKLKTIVRQPISH